MSDEGFLSRWSRRKRAAAAAGDTQAPVAQDGPLAAASRAPATVEAPDVPPAPASSAPPALPPLDSISAESDFSPFMAREVDPGIQRAALKKLFQDERFNVMDGLDVYIDDYTKLAPLPADMVRKLAHARYLFSPPRTRVNAEGIVEDVPDAADAQETQTSLAAPQAANSSETFTAPAGAAAAPLDAPTVESKPNS
jgi:Protein of unknown function (DUF3306)